MSEVVIEDSRCRLSLQEGNMIVKNGDREIVLNKSVKTIENVLVFGNPQISTQLLKTLAQHRVGVHYFSQNGKYITSLEEMGTDNYEKQVQQFLAFSDEAFRLSLAKRIIMNKISLQQQLLKAYDSEGLLDERDYNNFKERLQGVQQSNSINELLGQEGRAAKSYFYYLGLLMHDAFRFRGRSKKPALDPTNALLNMGYDLLYAYMRGIVKKYGLHLGIGCIHRNKSHHATLVSDLIEVWRPVIVEDTIMQLCNHSDISPNQFVQSQDGGYYVNKEARQVLYGELKQRLFEKHHYFHADKKVFTATYSMDLQICSLQRAIEAHDAQEYLLLGVEDEMV